MVYQLMLNQEDAMILAKVCEFYARIRMGQFNEILWSTLDCSMPSDYGARKEAAQRFLFEARKHIYPELHGIGHSYGIDSFVDADKAYDVYQAIRYAFGDDRTPFSYYEVPKFKSSSSVPGAYELYLTAEHAEIVKNACAFYTHIHMGLLTEVIRYTLDMSVHTNHYQEIYDNAIACLEEARYQLFVNMPKYGPCDISKFPKAMSSMHIYQKIEDCMNGVLSSEDLPKCNKWTLEEEAPKKRHYSFRCIGILFICKPTETSKHFFEWEEKLRNKLGEKMVKSAFTNKSIRTPFCFIDFLDDESDYSKAGYKYIYKIDDAAGNKIAMDVAIGKKIDN